MNSLLISVVAGLAVVAGVFFFLTYRDLKHLRSLRNYFSDDEQPENLEAIIHTISQKLKRLEQYREHSAKRLEELQTQLNTAYQKTAMHKYNAFADLGGNLSFCLVLLTNENNGYILTYLAGREHGRIYCKQVLAGISDQQLTTEEQKTLAIAIQQ